MSPADPKLPHDHDEVSDAGKGGTQREQNRRPIRQAQADLDAGLVDTERVGTPSDIPSPAKGRSADDRR